MSWFILIIAGLFEVAFVVTMKLSEGFRNKKYTVLTVLAGALSFLFVIICNEGIACWHGLCGLDRNWCSR